MGKVFEAWDLILDRPVALKRLHQSSPEALLRFFQEAQLQARVEHPFICRIFDVDSSQQPPIIAMQRIQGPSLEAAASDLTREQAVQILIRVCRAVHAAHRMKLIHRDLKPSNILLERGADGSWIPYVCDFGLAMGQDAPALTRTRTALGTPAYMPPEQVLGDRSQLGPASDVYALGATLYRVLLGTPPCISSADPEMLRIKQERLFPSPRLLQPDFPRNLEIILLKCLEPNPQHRYASAAALGEDLRRFLDGEPILAKPVGPLVRLWRMVRLHPWITAGILLLPLLLTGSVAWNRRNAHRSQRRDEAIRRFALEAVEMEQLLRVERMLPPHDLRPVYAKVRERMGALRDRMKSMDRDTQGAGYYALGRADLALHTYSEAVQELERAWGMGYQTPEVAYALGRAYCSNYWAVRRELSFIGDYRNPQPERELAQSQELFRISLKGAYDPVPFTQGNMRSLVQDLPGTLAFYKTSFRECPWHVESAVMASLTLSRMGREAQIVGNAKAAEGHYREALDMAQQAMSVGRSDEDAHEACASAAMRRAGLAWEHGCTAYPDLDEVERVCDEGLKLNPSHPEILSRKAQAIAQRAMMLRDSGHDPKGEILRGIAFLQAMPAPRTTANLKADWMILHWLMAQRAFERNEDPDPWMVIALQGAGHTAYCVQDFLGDLLLLKARIEMHRGEDPCGTLAEIRRRFEPLAEARRGVSNMYEILGEGALLEAQWVARNGRDGKEALASAEENLRKAVDLDPSMARSQSLLGLALAHKNRAEARRCLAVARSLNPREPHIPELQRLLRRE